MATESEINRTAECALAHAFLQLAGQIMAELPGETGEVLAYRLSAVGRDVEVALRERRLRTVVT